MRRALMTGLLGGFFALSPGAARAQDGSRAVDGPSEVTIAAPSNGAGFEAGGSVTFSGIATDPEDGTLTANLEWRSSLDGFLGSGGSVTRTDLADGAHTITASVRDSTGQTRSARIRITVGLPRVKIDAPAEGSQVVPGETITFTGTATDAQHGDLTPSLSWTSNLDGPLGTGGTLTRADLSPGVHRIRATVTGSGGLSQQAETTVTVASDAPVLVGAGDIASCSQQVDEATALLLDGIAGTVFTSGDNVYPDGTATQFLGCYDPTWGRHKARTRPASGNHDYHTTGASGYFNYFGAAAGDPSKGYYSYDLVGWHIIVLNSECSQVGGCTRTSPQGQWLQADLAAHPAACTLAYWHKPLFSSGGTHGGNTAVQPFWQLLYEAGADVVVNGHEHSYERFGQQNPNGAADGGGIRQFTVGTGGASLYPFGPPQPNSEARNDTSPGVLKLTLSASSYDWEFIPIAGKTFSDSGSDSCSTSATNAPPTAKITQPANGATFNVGDPVAFAGTATDPEDGNLTASLTWSSSRDGAIGTGGSFTRSDLTPGVHTITASVTDSDGRVGSSAITLTVGSSGLATFDKRVAAGADDAEEKATGRVALNGGGDLELVTDGTVQKVGLRFTGLTIPRGATVREAYLQFQADETYSGATSLTIQGQAADNPAGFSTAKFNVSSRPRTTNAVSWPAIAPWTSIGEAGAAQRTPSLSSIVQTIVNRPGWVSGNAMVFIITGSGRRTAEAFEGGAAKAPRLHVEYE